jgi:hypothetical protein
MKNDIRPDGKRSEYDKAQSTATNYLQAIDDSHRSPLE